MLFAGATTAFSVWQRRFIPRSFIVFAATIGSVTGCAYGCIRTAWFFTEQLDALGANYELSRVVKQDIFDSRPDLDSSTRANYYMYQ